MTQLDKHQVEQALAGYTDPYLQTDLVSAGAVQDIRILGGQVNVSIELDYPSEFLKTGVAQLLQTAIENLDGCQQATVNIGWHVDSHKSHEGGEGWRVSKT